MSEVLRVFLVAEGRSELGDLDALAGGPSKRKRSICAGYLKPILEKLFVGHELHIHAQKVTALGGSGRARKLPGHADRAAKALALAAVDNADVLVFVRDVDKAGGESKSKLERRKRTAVLRSEIEYGFAAVKEGRDVRTIIGTPCRMIEAWALGDARALTSHVGLQLTAPSKPEELWGDELNPSSNHPKRVLQRLLGRPATAEDFESLAMESDAARLALSCPESFAPFVHEVRSVLAARGPGQ